MASYYRIDYDGEIHWREREVYDHTKHRNYQYFPEVWFSKFKVKLTNEENNLVFLDKDGSAFPTDLTKEWHLTRSQINSMLRDFMMDYHCDGAGVVGLNGIMYKTDLLQEFIDELEEQFFYEMVEKEQKLKKGLTG